MNEIIIRPAAQKDIPVILKLIRELAEFEHGLNKVIVDEAILLRDGFGDHPLFNCILAEVDEKTPGMAVYFFSYSTWSGKCLYLEDIVVDRDYRMKGIGTALMKEVVRIGKEENVKRISWQVLNWNLDAIAFYRKLEANFDNEWINVGFNAEQMNSFDI